MIYVTFAKQDAAKHDDVAGPGNGFLDVLDPVTHTFTRLVSNSVLDSPWGLALAPSTFGDFAGDLLVGNFGDGTIKPLIRRPALCWGAFVTSPTTRSSIPDFWD